MSIPPSTEESSNKADGPAGERYAAAILACALCAQASNTTLQEDGKKLDLKISLLNTFSLHRSVITVHGQIKHGPSFARQAGEKITLQNIGDKTIPTLQAGSQPALLIWVPSWPDRKVYWHVVRPKGKHRNPIKIARKEYVTPGLRFELCRVANFERRSLRYPCLEIPAVVKNDLTVRASAKKHYAALKAAALNNPLLGGIEVTRFAWRHITRRSRLVSRRQRSFHVLKYLKSFLCHVPTRYLVDRGGVFPRNNKLVERNEIVFWYRHALRIGSETQTLLVRFVEEIEYPENWTERPLSDSEVFHKVTLMSWWFKPEKESGASLVHTDARRIVAASPHETERHRSEGPWLDRGTSAKKADSSEYSS